MDAFGFNQFGEPAVFEQLNIPEPTLKNGQVLIETLGFGINPYDASLRQGLMQAQRPLPFPIIPGSDAVGRIIAKAPDVDNFEIDEIVMAHLNLRGYSSHIAVSKYKIIKKPNNLPLEMAAALPMNAVTAYNILFQILKIKTDQTIIIQGASGGVGALLTQFAKHHGSKVIGIANSNNETYVKSLGVDEFLSYNTDDPTTKLQKSGDIVINATNGGHQLDETIEMVKSTGTVFSLTALPSLPIEQNQIKLQPMIFSKEFKDRTALAYLADYLDNQHLQFQIAETYPFNVDGVIKAHQDLTSHHPAGKLVVMK